MNTDNRDQVNLLDFFAFLVKWRKFLMAFIVSSVVVAAIVSFLIKPVYRSNASIRPQEESKSGIGSLISSKLAALGGIGGFTASLGEVSGQYFISILRNRQMSEKVIDKFSLKEVYKLKDEPIEKVIQALKSHTNFEHESATSSINIFVEDTDPKRAKEMVEFYIQSLDEINRSIKNSKAKSEREFIGQRLQETKDQLKTLEDSMFVFQMQTGVLNIEEQVKATIGAIASLEASKLATQTELELNKQIFDSGSPEVKMLELKLQSSNLAMKELIEHRSQTAENDFLLHLKDTPEQGLTYLRLYRDIEITQILMSFLIQQYEQAKIDEVRNTPTLQQIERPVEATLKIWPKRSIIVIISAFGALFIGIIIALAIDNYRAAIGDINNPNHNKLLKIKQNFSK